MHKIKRIDTEIQMCIQRMTLLRSAETAVKSLQQTLMVEEYQIIGNDPDPVNRIFDIFFPNKYTHESEGDSRWIEISVPIDNERRIIGCHFNFQTAQSNASLTFYRMEGPPQQFINITTSFGLILLLCRHFLPESSEKLSFLTELSKIYIEKENQIKQKMERKQKETEDQRKQEIERKQKETEDQRKQEIERKQKETEETEVLKQSLSMYVDGLKTFDLFTGSIKEFLDTKKIKGKIPKKDYLKLISDKLEKKIFPS